MIIWQLVLLGMALALNNAFAAIALGTSRMPRWHQLRTAVTFAVFEALMPILGVAIGETLAGAVGRRAHWFGVAVLAATGVYSLLKAEDEAKENEAGGAGTQTLLLAVALSLDNLSVGFGLGMFQVPFGVTAVIFGVVSLAMTLLGLEAGRILGSRLHISADKLSGAVLLVVAGVMAFT